jgi:hypothetical protein
MIKVEANVEKVNEELKKVASPLFEQMEMLEKKEYELAKVMAGKAILGEDDLSKERAQLQSIKGQLAKLRAEKTLRAYLEGSLEEKRSALLRHRCEQKVYAVHGKLEGLKKEVHTVIDAIRRLRVFAQAAREISAAVKPFKERLESLYSEEQKIKADVEYREAWGTLRAQFHNAIAVPEILHLTHQDVVAILLEALRRKLTQKATE